MSFIKKRAESITHLSVTLCPEARGPILAPSPISVPLSRLSLTRSGGPSTTRLVTCATRQESENQRPTWSSYVTSHLYRPWSEREIGTTETSIRNRVVS